MGTQRDRWDPHQKTSVVKSADFVLSWAEHALGVIHHEFCLGIFTSLANNTLYNKTNLSLILQLLSEEINLIKEQRDKNG